MENREAATTPEDGSSGTGRNKTVATDGLQLSPLEEPTRWPNANARLLGLAQGLPITPLERLSTFSPDDFERFVLEWADGFLRKRIAGVREVQQRGGAGDKGRDIIAWFGARDTNTQYWHLYQCKQYDRRLSSANAATEIGKVLYYAFNKHYTLPSEYWFVTRKGVAGPLQDLIDAPEKLRTFVVDGWAKHCAKKITSTKTIALDGDFRAFVDAIDFSFIRVKQPLDLIKEHAQTPYHLIVFGAPLIDRGPPPSPPSVVAPTEQNYIRQLCKVISELTGQTIRAEADFSNHAKFIDLYRRSRLTFYSAEGLKELARDRIGDPSYFDSLLQEFTDGLYHTYTSPFKNGRERLARTVVAAQAQQIVGHVLGAHMNARDREGICHHLANEGIVEWCDDD